MDGKHFSIVDLVVAFGIVHGLRPISDGMPEVVVAFLGDNSAGCVAGCIDFEACGSRRIEDGEDGFRSECLFQGVESVLLGFSPCERSVLFGEVVQGSRKLREVFDESTVEVGEADEGTDIFQALGCRSGSDGFDFDRIHGDRS